MSGAKNCPETPRQKMIGMMYLVLTAMLALNVSSDILNGFTMVDNSLHTTIESAESRNKALYSDFQSLYNNNPTKVKDWLDKAKVVKLNSDELFNYLENFKVTLVKMTDKDNAKKGAYVDSIIAKDNLDVPSQYGLKDGNAEKLKQKIEKYKNFLIMLSAGNPQKQEMYKEIFATKGGKEGKKWEDVTFEMMPVSAVVTILTKYQSDVRAAEAEIVQFLKAQTDVNDMRVNKIQALVIPDSRYVIRGDRYKAQIVLSAVDTTQKTSYFVNGSNITKGLYEVACSSAGQKIYSGQITVPGNDGITRSYAFKSDYMVGEPTATMSNEDLNVVYKGIDNRFSVSVPGVAAANIHIAVDGGSSVQTAPGKYIIRPSRDTEIKINVFATIDKKNLQMGGGSYRVKYLPDPKAFLQPADNSLKPLRGGFMSPSALKTSILIASYGNDELVKANFIVTSFTMIARGLTPQTITGSKLSTAFVDKLLKGDILMLNNIKAVGPDQRVRDLGSISILL